MNVYPYAVISINEMFQIAEFQYLVDICLRSEMTWELFMNVSNDEIDLRVIIVHEIMMTFEIAKRLFK